MTNVKQKRKGMVSQPESPDCPKLTTFEEIKKAERRNLVFVSSSIITLLILGIFLYIFSRTYAKAWRLGVPMRPDAFNSILQRSIPALVAMGGSAFLIAVVSLSFQTIVDSKILTPSMIGFDSIFMGTQTLLVFLFGTTTQFFLNPHVNFIVSAGVMVVVSFFMYSAILRRSKNNMIFLLMFGLVLSGVVSSGTRYLQTIMSFYEFTQVQALINVSLNNVNETLIYMVVPLMLILSFFMLFRHRIYNVLTLGSQQARGLGVDYQKELNFNLILIAIGMSLSTALIGSLTFLGLLAVNFARMVLKTHRHLPLFMISGLVAVITLILGEAIVELIQGAVPVTVVINLVGCSWVFYYIIKDNKI